MRLKMSMASLPGCVGLSLVMSGCVSMVSMTPAASSSQTLRYYSGAGLVSSNGQNCSVVFGPLEEVQNLESDSLFMIRVTNLTRQPITVRSKDISASAPLGWGGKDKPLRVIDRNVKITELEQERASARFAAAMVAVSAAAQSVQPVRSSGYVAGSGGSSAYWSSTTVNPAQAAQAQQSAISNSLAISNAADERFAQGMANRSAWFATNTVMPSDSYGALIGVKPPDGGYPIEATYQIGVCDEFHRFIVTYDKSSIAPEKSGPIARGGW